MGYPFVGEKFGEDFQGDFMDFLEQGAFCLSGYGSCKGDFLVMVRAVPLT